MKQRHKVLCLLGALSVLTFLDRLAIAIAGPSIQKELRIPPQSWGWILSAYILANGLFEIPSGAMGDRFGRRGELTRIVTWWSAFTALTGWCRGFAQLVAVRFLFGAGAAGAYPNSAGVIARWFPPQERARSQGIVWACSRAGGAMAPLLIVPAEQWFGWRPIFGVLGVAGFAWAAVWYRCFRDRPQEQPGIGAEELSEIGTVSPVHSGEGSSWSLLVRRPALWFIVAAYGCYGCASWFYFSWFPTWIVHTASFTMDGLLFTSLPFMAGVVCNLAGGTIADRLGLRLGGTRALRLIPACCLVATALVLVAMGIFHQKAAAVTLATLGFGIMDFMLPSAWALCLVVGGRRSGLATGIMNTAGQAGGFLCTVLFGYIVRGTGSYNLPIFCIAAMVLISAILFTRIEDKPEPATTLEPGAGGVYGNS